MSDKIEFKELTLADLLPERPTFTVSRAFGPDEKVVPFELGPLNLKAEALFERTVGADWERVFSDIEDPAKAPDAWDKIAQLVYILMTPADRARIPATRAKIVNHLGDQADVTLSGPEHLLQVMTNAELTAMTSAFTRAYVDSRPMLEPAVVAALKKKLPRINAQMRELAKTLEQSGA